MMQVVITVQVKKEGGYYSWDTIAENEVSVESENWQAIPWAAVCAGAVEHTIQEAQATLAEEARIEAAIRSAEVE